MTDRDYETYLKFKNMIRTMVEQATEVGMVRVKRKELFWHLHGLWSQLNKHILKLVIWGDSSNWRQEIRTFAVKISKVELKLKSRSFPSKEDHLDVVEDYRNTERGKFYFKTTFEEVSDSMKNPPKRDLASSQIIAYNLQMAFIEAFVSNKASYGNINSIIDSVLNAYPKIEADRK